MTTGSYLGLPDFRRPLAARAADATGPADQYLFVPKHADLGLHRNAHSNLACLGAFHLVGMSEADAAAIRPLIGRNDVVPLTRRQAALKLAELVDKNLSSWKFCAELQRAAELMDPELRDDPHMLDALDKAKAVLAARAAEAAARPPITPRPMR